MTPEEIIEAIEAQQSVPYSALDALGDRERGHVFDSLEQTPVGRAWLRRNPSLDTDQANRLLTYEEDFRQARRDISLTHVVECASIDAVIAHACSLASGAAATALWKRLQADNDVLHGVALAVVGAEDSAAAESTLAILVLDPINEHELTIEQRVSIAMTALRSPDEGIRGMAAGFLLDHGTAELLGHFDALIRDASEHVRGVVWSAALRLARDDATSLAREVLGDERIDVEVRRSALIAIGMHLPTADLVDLLSALVVHPNDRLAGDAADLLYSHHRNPLVAESARYSPHRRVRDIAEYLLDPYRGSPAAGGSRPGDPDRDSAGVFEEMIRSIEERVARNDNDTRSL